jgi:hypothetical protein
MYCVFFNQGTEGRTAAIRVFGVLSTPFSVGCTRGKSSTARGFPKTDQHQVISFVEKKINRSLKIQ